MITIRPAYISDLPALRILSIAAFVHAYAAQNTEEDMRKYVTTHFSEEKMLAEFAETTLHFLLAFENEELVGYTKLKFDSGVKGRAERPLEIARFYTKPERIGRGIGKQMLAAVEDYARANKYDAIWLGVWQKNFKAINFYQREGLRILETTQFVLGEDVQDDFVMMKKVD